MTLPIAIGMTSMPCMTFMTIYSFGLHNENVLEILKPHLYWPLPHEFEL